MRLIRPVLVKHIVTDKKKIQIIQQFKEDIAQTKREIEQLSFQLHKALRKNKESDQSKIHARYNSNIRSREDKLKNISFQIEQLDKLEEGMEIQEGTVDSIIDVSIGDRWPGSNQVAEIIIKDGIIQEIRESRNEDDRLV
ncbi:YlqD family protein [Halalkalibacter alkalisediminis]|uniref:YlqD family protein n=2 Tax=Halalkalibacter alkalisediminis TaxID=935616 RepID=A0ABV6NCX7_9BACI|nr:YlqD family protein [Halalkalibacter alkalisediminis]